MADKPLVTPEDAARLGYPNLTEGALTRASNRAKDFTKQEFLTTTATIETKTSMVYLPGRPVQSVDSVVDYRGNPLLYQLRPNNKVYVDTRNYAQSRTMNSFSNELLDDFDLAIITYTYGWDVLPDRVGDIICTIAARLQSLSPALAEGAQTESGGSESITFGWDSHSGVSDLVSGEKNRLNRLFPKYRGPIVMSA